MAGKVKHESGAVRDALVVAMESVALATASMYDAQASLVHGLARLMKSGVSVNAVKAEVVETGADKAIEFKSSYAQFIPMLSDALKLDGATRHVFGGEGMASLFARANGKWKKSGAGESFVEDVRVILGEAKAWEPVAERLAEVASWKAEKPEAGEGEGEGEGKPAKPAKGAKIDDLEPEALAEVLTLSAVSTFLAHLDATGYKASAHELGTLRNIATVARKLSAK